MVIRRVVLYNVLVTSRSITIITVFTLHYTMAEEDGVQIFTALLL